MVMPLAFAVEDIAARKRFIGYHVLHWVTVASGTPTLGSGAAGELQRSAATTSM